MLTFFFSSSVICIESMSQLCNLPCGVGLRLLLGRILAPPNPPRHPPNISPVQTPFSYRFDGLFRPSIEAKGQPHLLPVIGLSHC